MTGVTGVSAGVTREAKMRYDLSDLLEDAEGNAVDVFACGAPNCTCHGPLAEDGLMPGTYMLAVEEGAANAKCADCGCSPVEDIVELNMEPRRVSLRFVPDHPNLGGWHFDERCDCGWMYEVVEPAEVSS